MNKFQPVQFSDIDDLLSFLPKDELEITLRLRKIVYDSIPNVREKLSYNVPFYIRHSRICFIWPGSVPWGKITTGVSFGFCNGHLLNDEINYLEKESRKQVYTKTFHNLGEIEEDFLKAFLFEAVEIDERMRRKKKGL